MIECGERVRVQSSLIFPPEPSKPTFRVSLNRRRPYAFSDDELPYKANKVWFKVQRQGTVRDMANKVVPYKARDPEVWDFYLHPNGVMYENPGNQTDLRPFRYSGMAVQKAKARPNCYQDYEEIKVAIKSNDTVDGMRCFLYMPSLPLC